MATDTLNIDGVSDKGAWTGTNGDIFEAIASADGNELANAQNEGDNLICSLSSSVITDADTITNVSIVFRGRRGSNFNDGMTIQFAPGGSLAGVPVAHGNLADGTMQNSASLNDVGWNSDWSAAQIAGALIEIVPTQAGMPGTVDVGVDCIDVIITFTPAPSAGIVVAALFPRNIFVPRVRSN